MVTKLQCFQDVIRKKHYVLIILTCNACLIESCVYLGSVWIYYLHSHTRWKSELQWSFRCNGKGTSSSACHNVWSFVLLYCSFVKFIYLDYAFVVILRCWWKFGYGNQQLYWKLYPNEELFPETTSSPENSEDDAGLTLESWRYFAGSYWFLLSLPGILNLIQFMCLTVNWHRSWRNTVADEMPWPSKTVVGTW